MSKKPIINRKIKKVRKLIFISSILLISGLCLLLISAIWIILARTRVISPLPLIVQNKTEYFINSRAAESTIKDLLGRYGISSIDIHVDHDIIDLTLQNGSEVVLSSNKSIENQIASLQLLINHFTIEGKAIKKIDLRFDKPVVEFEK